MPVFLPVAAQSSPGHPPTGPSKPVLRRQAVPEEMRYRLLTERTEFAGGPVRRSSLATTLGLRVLPHGANWQLDLRAQPASLQKPDPTAFDEIALLLSGLYARLVIEAAPTGELLQVLNLPEVRQRWPAIEQALHHKYPAPSEVLAVLLPDVARQLARPDALLTSLGYNYAYAALLGDFYEQSFAAGSAHGRLRRFPGFYDGLDLVFTETRRLAPAPTSPGCATLQLTGATSQSAGQVAAIAAHVQAALGTAEAVVAADIACTYQATHCVALATGLPVAVELAVACTYRQRYRKEYYLTIQAEPTP